MQPNVDIMSGLKASGPKPPPAVEIKAVLTDEDTYGSTMLVLAGELLPDEFLKWHPKTILAELERVSGADIPQLNFDKLMAAVTIVTTDLFWRDESKFIHLCNVLSGSTLEPDVFDPADSMECAWGINEALLLDPPDDSNPEPFSDAIRHYVGHVLKEEGYVSPPDVLKIALDADFSEHVRYNFGDDPELSAGIFATQQGKAQEVEDVVKDGLKELFTQLENLPLREGSTADLKERIAHTLKRLG